MSSEYVLPKDESGTREVLQALREAFIAANGRLSGASIEEIAEQLIVGGHHSEDEHRQRVRALEQGEIGCATSSDRPARPGRLSCRR